MADDDTHTGKLESTDRRTTLRLIGGAAATVTGLAGVSAAASAFNGDDGDVTGSADYPRVTTRDHFDVHWWYGDQLTDGHTATDYDTVGAIPGWDGGGAPGELVVAVHGWLTAADEAPDHFATVETSLAENEFDAPVVGFSYDADTGVSNWWPATDIAERNGPKLAAFLADYADQHPATAVRLTGHSLGARVVLSAIESLHQAGRDDVVASATLLGGAADDGAVSTDGRYGAAIEAAGGQVDNFWKDDDGVLQWAYSTGEFDSAVGEEGCDGPRPANYTDHNVDYVPDHFSYHEPADGCMPAVVDAF
ncbi:hypothetical protein GCM10028857_27620 [Salinarchaeum chitinilyticum]